jgi:hypothetical protein
MKQKVYVLMISKVFPATHPRKGQPTYFREKILCKSLTDEEIGRIAQGVQKITTIRLNYDLWASRAEKINAGKAILSLRQWSGKPYRSKQVEFLQLEKIGVQKLVLDVNLGWFIDDYDSDVTVMCMAKNDGLSLDDFKKWFGKIKTETPYAIIHFTDFKY